MQPDPIHAFPLALFLLGGEVRPRGGGGGSNYVEQKLCAGRTCFRDAFILRSAALDHCHRCSRASVTRAPVQAKYRPRREGDGDGRRSKK